MALFMLCALSIGLGLLVIYSAELSLPWRIGLIVVMSLTITLLMWWCLVRPFQQQTRALNLLVRAWRDADFSTSIAPPTDIDLNELTGNLNSIGDVLRRERAAMAQREQLLDSVLQHAGAALLMLDNTDRIIFANPAAVELLQIRDLLGTKLEQAMAKLAKPLQDACLSAGEHVIALESEHAAQFLVTRKNFSADVQQRSLLMLRELTQPLARSEVRLWKDALRVLSHELNNTLGSLSSLSYSAQQFLQRDNGPRVLELLQLMGQRSQRLAGFLAQYARIARLPKPQRQHQAWSELLTRALTLAGAGQIVHCAAEHQGYFDAVQLEQALLNIIKNAVEAGADAKTIRISAWPHADFDLLEVADEGPGMSSETIAQALLPFFSTKRIASELQVSGARASGAGSGIGLALVREICEAHGGTVSLLSNQPRGLRVLMRIPHV